MTFSTETEWVSTDGWRGYERPIYAIAGASDTGMWSDSPCPTNIVSEELGALKQYLRSKGIKYREIAGRSSNAFMAKRWIISTVEHHKKALRVANEWLQKNRHTTRYIHER
jgi:hypothetical protein